MDKERVVTINGVCEIMECSRQQYYIKYKAMLTPIQTDKAKVLYKEADVLELKRRELEDEPYEIVK